MVVNGELFLLIRRMSIRLMPICLLPARAKFDIMSTLEKQSVHRGVEPVETRSLTDLTDDATWRGLPEIGIGLLGMGTVGSGVIRLIEAHAWDLAMQTGHRLLIHKALVQDLEKERPYRAEHMELTTDASAVLEDPDIKVIIEVIGGIEPARTYIERALRLGKHVVTANKDLMALHGSELKALAEAQGLDLFYEASVGGGIPIIRTLVDSFASDRITRIVGIINGTTNYMLTQMTRHGQDFARALQEAQALGYAEADPSSDVDGWDAARKMVILSTLSFHMPITLDDVPTRGIRDITPRDIALARELGYVVKLVGQARRDNGAIELSVEPMLIPRDHPLANVNDAFNAVFVHGEAVGETMFYGRGAGSLPTATAVVADLVHVIRNQALGVSGRRIQGPVHEKKLLSPERIKSRFYLRLTVTDAPGVLAEITQHMAESGVSIERINQYPDPEKNLAEVLIITHEATLAAWQKLGKLFEQMPAIQSIDQRLRVLV